MEQIQNRWDGIIFDIDGTLWDVRREIAEAWQQAIREHTSLPVSFTAESLGSMFGRTMRDIFQTLYPQVSEQEMARVIPLLYQYQHALLREKKPPLYPGAREVLQKLFKQYPLFIVTNAQKGYIEILCEANDIGALFTDWLCFGDTGQEKNVTLQLLMKKNHLQNAVYIGDTGGDADSCQKAGIPMIYASYGLGRVEDPWQSITSIRELPGLLERLCSLR